MGEVDGAPVPAVLWPDYLLAGQELGFRASSGEKLNPPVRPERRGNVTYS